MATVVAVAAHPAHAFSKPVKMSIHLVTGLGVEGDAHLGATVKHRSRVARDPSVANLRQVHLLHAELLDELAAKGFPVAPGDIGENVLTWGIALLELPRGTRLQLGPNAIVELTGLRNPCAQLDNFRPGLMAAVLDRDPDGRLMRKAGVMAIVVNGGEIAAGDPVSVRLPAGPHERLEPV